MLRILLFLLSFSAFAGTRVYVPQNGFQDNFWQQVQIQHLQTQQQLQAQDQYRRFLLLQDQERQIQQIMDQQDQLEYMQRNLIMHEHSDRLRMYTRPIKVKPETVKKNNKAAR
jgi:hypothetical protein